MSKFNIEDGIPIARRHNREASGSSRGGLLALPGDRFSIPIAMGGILLLTSAAVAGVLLAGGGVSPVARSDLASSNMEEAEPESLATQPDPIQPDPIEVPTRDSILGHYEYSEAEAVNLRPVGSFNGRTEQLHAAAAARYLEMQAKAKQSGIQLATISGFRSLEAQNVLFFQVGQSQSLTPQERALVSAPPGYSEHHTGYAIDIGDANHPETHLQTSFDTTPAFRWLLANAAQFGFELSFPIDNEQGVSYEPWHWRFVGDSPSLATFYANLNRPSRTEASGE